MKSRRFGKFSIHRKFIKDNPEIVREIMGECIILDARSDEVSDTIEYLALSDNFHEVKEGEIPQVYKITIVNEYDSAGRVLHHSWEFEVH